MTEKKRRRFWEQKAWGDMSWAEKTGMMMGWCVIAASAAYFVFDSKGESGETKAATVQQPVPASASVTNDARSEHAMPLSLDDARTMATNSLKMINQAEQSLDDGIKLGDRIGVIKNVRKPLQEDLDKWPSMLESSHDDQRQHFAYCHEAEIKLMSLSHTALQERTVESLKFLRKDQEEYEKTKKQCEQSIKTTSSEINTRIASEDAELKKSIGGRECLTVFDLDKQTGKIFARPKPAHCKPSPL